MNDIILRFPIHHNSSWNKLTRKSAIKYNVTYNKNVMYNKFYNQTISNSFELLKNVTPNIKRHKTFDSNELGFEFVSSFTCLELSNNFGFYFLTLQKNMQHLFYGIWQTTDLQFYKKIDGDLMINYKKKIKKAT